jgi:hypothetical protein
VKADRLEDHNKFLQKQGVASWVKNAAGSLGVHPQSAANEIGNNQKRWEVRMSDVTVANASQLLQELSLPQDRGETIKEIITRTARAAQLAYWRTFDLWYEKARRVEPEEIERIIEALRLKNEKAAKNELHELKFRLARLEATLASGDADFHRPSIDFARDTMRRAGR